MKDKVSASVRTLLFYLSVSLISPTGLRATAQNPHNPVLAPPPIQEIAVAKVDGIDLAPQGSCLSVEGPRMVSRDGGITVKPAPDDFTSCSLTLFQGQLAKPAGTQKTEDMLLSLEGCFANPVMKQKPALIIGHGSPGLISTGNGLIPGVGQTISAEDRDAIERLGNLNTSTLLLFGCETGAEKAGQTLVNSLGQKVATRARNGLVFCSLDPQQNGERKGLYVMQADDQKWVKAKPSAPAPFTPVASKEIQKQSCFAIKKKNDGFKILTNAQFKDLMNSNKISVFDYFVADKAVSRTDFSAFDTLRTDELEVQQFNALVRRESRRLIEKIDFCKTLPTYLVPDVRITGTLTFDIEGETRLFNVLSDRLVQDAVNTEIYYSIEPGVFRAFDTEVTKSWERIVQSKRYREQRQKQRE